MGEISDDLIDSFMFGLPRNSCSMGVLEEMKIRRKIEIQKRKKMSGYKRIHTDKDGNDSYLMEMDDSHLENTINLFIKMMVGIKSSALLEVNDSRDLFSFELNGRKKLSRQEAVTKISEIMYSLEPYLTELVIRGNAPLLSEVSEQLEKILERKNLGKTGLHEFEIHGRNLLE